MSFRSLSRIPLQPFAHRGRIDAGVARQPLDRPPAVIAAVAQAPLLRREDQQRCGQLLALRIRPPRLELVEDRHIHALVQSEERRPASPPHVDGDSHGDAPKPRQKRRVVVQIANPAKCAQVCLLRRILGQRLITQDAEGDGKHHPLGGLDEPAVGRDVTTPRPADEIVQRIHVVTKKDTRREEL